MTVYTTQWGIGPAWADLPTTDPASIATLIPGSALAGAVFLAPLTQPYETAPDGSILDPPIVTGITFTGTFSRAAVGGGSDNQLEILLVPEAQPLSYSVAREPGSRNELSLGTFTLDIPDPALTEVELDVVISASVLADVRAYVTSRSTWNGKLALTLVAAGASSFRVNNHDGEALALTVTQTPFFSGMTGGAYGGAFRFVRDGRYGMPAGNRDLVRDGDNPSLWVRAWDFDPEDPEQTYQPRPGEGTVDDEVT